VPEETVAADSAMTLARHYLEIDRPQQALDALRSPGSDLLDDPWFWLLRGWAYYDLDQRTLAMQAIQKGLAVAPEHPNLLFLLAMCEERGGNLVAAEHAILRALRQQPENSYMLCTYARILAQGDQFPKAERLLDRARQQDPDEPEVQRTAALLSYLRGDDRRAAQISLESLRDDPDDVRSRHALGAALLRQGRVTAANRHLKAAARLQPEQKAIAGSARVSRVAAHWLLLPLRPLYRIGTVGVWFGAIAIYFLLTAAGLGIIAKWFALAYLVLCVYSWVVPPILKWWYRRRYGGHE